MSNEVIMYAAPFTYPVVSSTGDLTFPTSTITYTQSPVSLTIEDLKKLEKNVLKGQKELKDRLEIIEQRLIDLGEFFNTKEVLEGLLQEIVEAKNAMKNEKKE